LKNLCAVAAGVSAGSTMFRTGDVPVYPNRKPGWYDKSCFKEPTLRELLDDPTIRSLMVSDGVDPERLWELLLTIAQHLARSRER
jgi:hypothetical protein